MAKLVELDLDENKVPIKHTYEAKDGKRFSAPFGAIAEAAADAHDEFEASTLGKMMRERTKAAREAQGECVSFTLRMPRSLSRQLHNLAASRRMSLNALLLTLLSKEAINE